MKRWRYEILRDLRRTDFTLHEIVFWKYLNDSGVSFLQTKISVGIWEMYQLDIDLY